ncbi:DNA mismatch repair protein MutS [Gloeobacter kilaueensis]|uniref:DNA mismatch repair protein MutS n=1 Tax=Gloeobacter kilaueensis (strain ATCC BAA-2537 / CCAP 1431/1 / ULC 316 / JS1) TaxID=1183438 RepID=U5QRC0_GLOK1|nr:DNA mismatch repair protein MutS [Gloeobacter kilaueensis]AGY60199.1 DNA mismatch repair protein MutS [Gloeobacter kilaueensis JS1]
MAISTDSLSQWDFRRLERSRLTPMLQQYIDVKAQYPHCLLLYRMGDFYETFLADAEVVARELEIVLTSRHAGETIGRVPMAGIPHHALERYCAELIDRGFAVVICDQMESPEEAKERARQAKVTNRRSKADAGALLLPLELEGGEEGQSATDESGLVRRAVTRVLTPGTVLEEQLLVSKKNNYLVALVQAADSWGLAFADVSTGEFQVTQLEGVEPLVQELLRLQPAEVLLSADAPDPLVLLRPGEASSERPDYLPSQFCYTLRPRRHFDFDEARRLLLETFRVRSLEGFGCEQLPLAIRAAGGLVQHLQETQKGVTIPLDRIRTYALSQYLILDHQTRRNLELTQTVRDGMLHGSLLWALDRTRTAMGARTLRRWLLQPLLDLQRICRRQDSIAELVDNTLLRERLQRLLESIYDLERLAGRCGSGTANARDLVALGESLLKLPALAEAVAEATSPYLKALQNLPAQLEQLGSKLRRTIVDNPPLILSEGGLIREGVDDDLEALRRQLSADRQWLVDLEARERARTGIQTLKVGFNKAFGYYLSISRGKADLAPADYQRKQTLTGEERYITPELKERENRILNAQQQNNQLEYDIFNQLRQEAGCHVDSLRLTARRVAALDALASLAEVAVYCDYCRPQLSKDHEIAIVGGRHPVIEQVIPAGFFVPNDTHLGGLEAPELVILTGPNMSGKSSYIRQVALIQLLAQVGSFVPASSARLGVSDRIFTRVGAVDDLATGQSTFMVEMTETANILNHATARSLVLLDEIGRGTATFDGLAIAWAVAEYLADQIHCRTIFATHYHELNELATVLANVANYQVTVQELADRIVFLHRVSPGGADRSYGIEVGRLAGLPPAVISRARTVLAQVEQHSQIALGLRDPGRAAPALD